MTPTATSSTVGKAKAAKKKTIASKSKDKKPAASSPDHPKYSEMIHQALTTLKERGGSSRQAVLKYIMKNFNVGTDEAFVNTHLKMALRAGVKNATLRQSKGTGATGSFRIGNEAKTAKKVSAAKKKQTAAGAGESSKGGAKATKGAKKPSMEKKTSMTKKKTAAATAKPKVQTKKQTAAAKPKKPAATAAAAKPKTAKQVKAVGSKSIKQKASKKPASAAKKA